MKDIIRPLRVQGAAQSSSPAHQAGDTSASAAKKAVETVGSPTHCVLLGGDGNIEGRERLSTAAKVQPCSVLFAEVMSCNCGGSFRLKGGYRRLLAPGCVLGNGHVAENV